MDPITRIWTDGIFTATLRNLINSEKKSKFYYIVFDGDVDPDWVENLNALLDDNKMVTLPNGERLHLPEYVRILIEVDSLKHATPATVTRCGVIICFICSHT